jgi:hypothetical protein
MRNNKNLTKKILLISVFACILCASPAIVNAPDTSKEINKIDGINTNKKKYFLHHKSS